MKHLSLRMGEMSSLVGGDVTLVRHAAGPKLEQGKRVLACYGSSSKVEAIVAAIFEGGGKRAVVLVDAKIVDELAAESRFDPTPPAPAAEFDAHVLVSETPLAGLSDKHARRSADHPEADSL
jgi:hypothetical protein